MVRVTTLQTAEAMMSRVRMLLLALLLSAPTHPMLGQGGTTGQGATPPKAAAESAKSIVDLNSATEAELIALPGIGAKKAAKIIAARPFANKTQLVSKGILKPKEYEKIKDRLVAKQ